MLDDKCRRTAAFTMMTLGSAGVMAQTANAPDEQVALAEVVVTATKNGATDLQKTPLAVTAFNADQLSQQLALNIKDVADYTPNLRVSQVATSAVLAIRGIGSNNVYAGSDPDVTMQVDGVYIARPSGQFASFLDVDRVEVLRGPQGTLYGRNAVGGTINIISRQPTDTFASQIAVTGGNFGLAQAQAYVSGPIIEGKLQGSLSVDYLRHDHYQDNIAVGGQDGLDNANRGAIRAQLRYEPTDWINMSTRADWSFLSEDLQSYDHLVVPFPADTVGATIIGNYHKVAINSRQYDVQHAGGVSEEINLVFNDHYALKSISAYRQQAYHFPLDTDDTPLTVNYGVQNETENQLSQEFNFNVSYDRFKGVAGVYYFYESEEGLNDVVVPSAKAERATAPSVWTHSVAAFMQGTYDLTSSLKLTVGGRYTRETKSIEANYGGYALGADLERVANAPGFPISFSTAPTFNAFTPKFGLDWQVAPAALLYVSATRGYKSGGENYAATSLATSTFSPEYIWSYEAGAKTEWFDRRLRVNLTGFYYDYKDLQVQSSIAAGVSVIGNAATAKIKGVEAEITSQITSGFQVNAVLSWLDAKYGEFGNASVPNALKPFLAGNGDYNTALATFNATGNYLNYAPRYSGSLGGQYTWQLAGDDSVFAHADVYYQAREYFDPSNASVLSQAPYGTVNASLGWTSHGTGWQVELWGKNLTDRQYLIAMVASSLEPAGVAAAPRTYGVRVSKKW